MNSAREIGNKRDVFLHLSVDALSFSVILLPMFTLTEETKTLRLSALLPSRGNVKRLIDVVTRRI